MFAELDINFQILQDFPSEASSDLTATALKEVEDLALAAGMSALKEAEDLVLVVIVLKAAEDLALAAEMSVLKAADDLNLAGTRNAVAVLLGTRKAAADASRFQQSHR